MLIILTRCNCQCYMIVSYIIINITCCYNDHIKQSFYCEGKKWVNVESACWCLGCAHCMLLIITAMVLAGGRNVVASLRSMPFLEESENYAQRDVCASAAWGWWGLHEAGAGLGTSWGGSSLAWATGQRSCAGLGHRGACARTWTTQCKPSAVPPVLHWACPAWQHVRQSTGSSIIFQKGAPMGVSFGLEIGDYKLI